MAAVKVVSWRLVQVPSLSADGQIITCDPCVFNSQEASKVYEE